MNGIVRRKMYSSEYGNEVIRVKLENLFTIERISFLLNYYLDSIQVSSKFDFSHVKSFGKLKS